MHTEVGFVVVGERTGLGLDPPLDPSTHSTMYLLDWSSLIDSRTKLSKHLVVPNAQPRSTKGPASNSELPTQSLGVQCVQCGVHQGHQLSETLAWCSKGSRGALEPLLSRFTEEEELQITRMLQRVDVLAKKATEVGVWLIVDAEQTYFQPAISHLTLEMQRRFNMERPLILSTHQCYLKNSSLRVDPRVQERGPWVVATARPAEEVEAGVTASEEKERSLPMPAACSPSSSQNQPRVFNEQEEDSNLYEDPLDVPDTPNLEGST
ncbi:hypothetical protein P7K49_003049 [Saguinus oedipus]|uniref:Proline dehydrogenase n=1 Tax=Saguinus oedipus TaxID=9490 RepID=A0ABQ9WJ18_SAGOE|nr:hypothetical protein P7K49_003049 [Saguinus oedipus]